MSTREEIEALTARLAQLVTNKDFYGIGSYYKEQARLQKLIESGVVALDLHAVDVIEAGDFGIEIGRITVTIKAPGVMALILFLMGKRRLVKQAKWLTDSKNLINICCL